MRHLQLWWDGEIHDKDSGLDHMAHIAASAMIVMDAAAHGKLNHDFPSETLAHRADKGPPVPDRYIQVEELP